MEPALGPGKAPTAAYLSTTAFWNSRRRRRELIGRQEVPGRSPSGIRELTADERARADAIDPAIGQPFGLWVDAGYTDAQIADWWPLVTFDTVLPLGAARLARYWDPAQVAAARTGAPVVHRGTVLIPGARDTTAVVATSITAAIVLLDYLAGWYTHQAALTRAWRDETLTDLVTDEGVDVATAGRLIGISIKRVQQVTDPLHRR